MRLNIFHEFAVSTKGRLKKKLVKLVTLSKLTFTPTPPRLIVTFFKSDKVVFFTPTPLMK